MLISLLLWAAFVPSASAELTLKQLLDGLEITRVSEFRYTETREMKLLNQTSVAKGRMYVSPERMAIEQTKPGQALILIAANRLQYLEPSRGIHFVKPLNGPHTVPGIGSFLGLLRAQMSLEQLQTQFLIELQQSEKYWKIILLPREQVDTGRMVISGLTGRGANLLELGYIDGDVTTWALSLVSEGPEAQQNMDTLLKLAETLSQPDLTTEH